MWALSSLLLALVPVRVTSTKRQSWNYATLGLQPVRPVIQFRLIPTPVMYELGGN